MNILITGSAGFIGFHFTRKIIMQGFTVVGLDSMNDYYDVNLKIDRLKENGILNANIPYGELIQSSTFANYRFIKIELDDKSKLEQLFANCKFDIVCNLAAQAGVRYSLINPYSYIRSNISGFITLLESCRNNEIKHLVYASTSSVYGLNTHMPLSPHDPTEHPMTLYAATKKANEMMAHSYSHLFKIPSTGLRFFTVYGPWGRPDMALFLFTKAILEGRPIDIYNFGKMDRDFTYVNDIVDGMFKIILHPPLSNENWDSNISDSSSSSAPYKIYNIGNSNPVKLETYIMAIEKALKKNAIKNYLPIQPGDVPSTYADMKDVMEDFNYCPSTSIDEGIDKFVEWYRNYFKV